MIQCWKMKKLGLLSLDEPVTNIKNTPNHVINSTKKKTKNFF